MFLKRWHKKDRGFTLIEMVLTITIIIVLSSISVPLYRSYTNDAMMAEGYLLLSTIRDAQKNYYSEYETFLRYQNSSSGGNYTHHENVLGINAYGNKYFVWFYTGTSGTSDHYFGILAKKPPELQNSNDNDLSLMLEYNMTLGQRIINYPKDYDDSWK